MRSSASLSRRLSALAIPLFVAAIASCDGCDDGDGSDPCTTVYKDQCGQPCALDVNCAAGLYCGPEGKCLADCTPDGGQCEAGVECTDRGRCGGEGSTASFGQGGGFGTGGGTGSGCAGISLTFEPTTPTVLLMIDQSGSMTEQFGGGNRWDVLYDVLMNPADGIVTQIDRLQVGASAVGGVPMVTIVRRGTTYVEANYKETDLANMAVGQPATIEFDAYPGLEVEGRVASIGAGTGSQFSILPAQNANGNWVKVTQRVPVRIRIDGNPGRPMIAGLSADVTIDTQDRAGPRQTAAR